MHVYNKGSCDQTLPNGASALPLPFHSLCAVCWADPPIPEKLVQEQAHIMKAQI